MFQEERATVFLPLLDNAEPTRPKLVGRVELYDMPAAELAIVTHAGSHDDIDAAYGELGAYVTAHEIGVDGPQHKYYLRDPISTPPTEWLTEIAWPIFRTG